MVRYTAADQSTARQSLRVCAEALRRVQLFETLWTVACQAPLSMGFPRQEYWGGLPFPSPGDPPNPGIELVSPTHPALAGEFLTPEPPGKPSMTYISEALTHTVEKELWLLSGQSEAG